MSATTLMTTDDVGRVTYVRTAAATCDTAVRNRAHAGTRAATTGELRLVPAAIAVTDPTFTVPGTCDPGGPPA